MKFPLLLATVLCVLFWKSFVPGYVHFSNDGPLGQQVQQFKSLPGGFASSWSDANDLGGNNGYVSPDIKGLFARPDIAVKIYCAWVVTWLFICRWKREPKRKWIASIRSELQSSPKLYAYWIVAASFAVGLWLMMTYEMMVGDGTERAISDCALWGYSYMFPIFTLLMMLTLSLDKPHYTKEELAEREAGRVALIKHEAAWKKLTRKEKNKFNCETALIGVSFSALLIFALFFSVMHPSFK